MSCINFHGSTGFGQAFTDSITGDMATKVADDVLKGTDVLAREPFIDPNRMAAAGGSYGGYMMAWLNGHTDRFKAMVCHAGVYNWHSMVASDFVKGRERSLGAPPWGELKKVDQQNAQRYAKKLVGRAYVERYWLLLPPRDEGGLVGLPPDAGEA